MARRLLRPVPGPCRRPRPRSAAASSIISTPPCSARGRDWARTARRCASASPRSRASPRSGLAEGDDHGEARLHRPRARASPPRRPRRSACRRTIHDARDEGPRRRAARCLQGEGPEDRDGRILHRRSRGRPADGDLRLLGRGRARVRDLFQRGQDRSDRRSGRSDRRPRRRQRAGRPRHGGGSARPFPCGCDGGRSPALPDRPAGRRRSRSGSSISGWREEARRRSTWSGATAISGGRPYAAGPWRMRCPCWNRPSPRPVPAGPSRDLHRSHRRAPRRLP